jgi:hypothetical protein
MLAPADALPLAVERTGLSLWRRMLTRPTQHRREVSALDQCDIGREAYPLSNPGVTAVWATAWLVFYVIVAIHHFLG